MNDRGEYESESDELSDDEVVSLAAKAGTPDPSKSIWDTNDAVESLVMERQVTKTTSNEDLTKELLSAAAPMAAQRIIHIALHDPNGNTALRAATYITDKAYGDESAKPGKSLWEEMVGTVVSDLEVHANRTFAPSSLPQPRPDGNSNVSDME